MLMTRADAVALPAAPGEVVVEARAGLASLAVVEDKVEATNHHDALVQARQLPPLLPEAKR
jgi:hypothetical protein